MSGAFIAILDRNQIPFYGFLIAFVLMIVVPLSEFLKEKWRLDKEIAAAAARKAAEEAEQAKRIAQDNAAANGTTLHKVTHAVQRGVETTMNVVSVGIPLLAATVSLGITLFVGYSNKPVPRSLQAANNILEQAAHKLRRT